MDDKTRGELMMICGCYKEIQEQTKDPLTAKHLNKLNWKLEVLLRSRSVMIELPRIKK